MSEEEPTYLYEFARNNDELTLIEYLIHAEKPLLRYRAAELLGGLRMVDRSEEAHQRVNQALMRAVKTDTSDAVQAAAIDALFLRGAAPFKDLVDELVAQGYDVTPFWMDDEHITDWLEADHPEFRMAAAAALGRIGDTRATVHLAGIIDDSDVRVRVTVVEALEELDDARSVPALASRLSDSHQRVRRKAAIALASIGTDRALYALSMASDSQTRDIQLDAIDSLGSAGTDNPLPILIERIQDESPRVREAATKSILKLMATADGETSDQTRQSVAEAVTEANPPDFLSNVLSIVDADHPEPVRRNATWLVSQLLEVDADHYAQARAHLIRSLDDPDPFIANLAKSTLPTIDDPDLETALEETLESGTLSSRGRERAEFVYEKLEKGPSKEVVTNAVDFTRVSDPAEYTKKKRDQDQSTDESG